MLNLFAALAILVPQDDVDREVQRLKRRLELNEEQEAKVREILKKESDAKKEARERIREALTDDQKQKFDKRGGGDMERAFGDLEGQLKRLEDFGGGVQRVFSTGGSSDTGRRLQKELGLSDEQVKKVDEIAREHNGDGSKWAQGFDGKFDWKEFQKKQEEDHKALGEKIKPVLTEEQRGKFDEAWAKQSPTKAWGGGGDGGPGFQRFGGADRGDRVKRAMEALKIENAEEAAATRQAVEKVVRLQKELGEHGDKVRSRARELAKDAAMSDEAVGKEIETLREERRTVEKNIAAAQKDLREIVTYRQELALIEQGILR